MYQSYIILGVNLLDLDSSTHLLLRHNLNFISSLTMCSIAIPDDIMCMLVQQLPDLIKHHPEPCALQYLLEKLESSISLSKDSQHSGATSSEGCPSTNETRRSLRLRRTSKKHSVSAGE